MRRTKLQECPSISQNSTQKSASEILFLKFENAFRILSLLCLLLVTGKTDSGDVKPKIIGGADAQPGEFPWMVSFQRFSERQKKYVHTCGGAIVDHRHIITATHCYNPEAKYRVLVGAHNISQSDSDEPSRKSYEPCRFHIHPDWKKESLTNDILMVTLKHPMDFNDKVQPIRLAPSDSDPVGQTCVVSGWGWLGGAIETTILQKCNLKVISLEECSPWGEGDPLAINDFSVCTVPEQPDKGTGPGDSGSPLICYDKKGPYATGVISWGPDPPDL
ncbi:unnamed protein product, partial [Allacma fusca]